MLKSRNEDVVLGSIYLGPEIRRKWKTEEKGRKEGRRKGWGLFEKCSLRRHSNQENNTWLPRLPPPHDRLLLSIHFIIWCHFQLIYLLVFHQHFFLWVTVFPFKGRNVTESQSGFSCSSFSFSCKHHWRITLSQSPLCSKACRASMLIFVLQCCALSSSLGKQRETHVDKHVYFSLQPW